MIQNGKVTINMVSKRGEHDFDGIFESEKIIKGKYKAHATEQEGDFTLEVIA